MTERRMVYSSDELNVSFSEEAEVKANVTSSDELKVDIVEKPEIETRVRAADEIKVGLFERARVWSDALAAYFSRIGKGKLGCRKANVSKVHARVEELRGRREKEEVIDDIIQGEFEVSGRTRRRWEKQGWT